MDTHCLVQAFKSTGLLIAVVAESEAYFRRTASSSGFSNDSITPSSSTYTTCENLQDFARSFTKTKPRYKYRELWNDKMHVKLKGSSIICLIQYISFLEPQIPNFKPSFPRTLRRDAANANASDLMNATFNRTFWNMRSIVEKWAVGKLLASKSAKSMK